MDLKIKMYLERKGIAFNDRKSKCPAFYRNVLEISMVNNFYPAIRVNSTTADFVIPFRNEDLCRKWLQFLIDEDESEMLDVTDELLAISYAAFDRLTKEITDADSISAKEKIQYVISCNDKAVKVGENIE